MKLKEASDVHRPQTIPFTGGRDQRPLEFPEIVDDAVSNASCHRNWQALRTLEIDPRTLAQHRIVTVARKEPAHVAFDVMRTKTLRTLRRNNWRRVGITSPTPGCGKTAVSLNLAFSFANHAECRTALLDLDLRRPQMAEMLGITDARPMAHFLSGDNSVAHTFLRYGDNLAVGANGSSNDFAAEILQGAGTGPALETLDQDLDPDVVLIDLPPMHVNDDVLAFLPHVDCMLILAAAGVSTIAQIDACERELSSETNVLGVVLNKCHYIRNTGY